MIEVSRVRGTGEEGVGEVRVGVHPVAANPLKVLAQNLCSLVFLKQASDGTRGLRRSLLMVLVGEETELLPCGRGGRSHGGRRVVRPHDGRHGPLGLEESLHLLVLEEPGQVRIRAQGQVRVRAHGEGLSLLLLCSQLPPGVPGEAGGSLRVALRSRVRMGWKTIPRRSHDNPSAASGQVCL